MDGSATRRGAPTTHVVFADRHGDGRLGRRGPALRRGRRHPRRRPRLRATPTSCCAARRPTAWRAVERAAHRAQHRPVPRPARHGRGRAPTCDKAERIARYKSGKYTIERPLHLGAALAAPDRAASCCRRSPPTALRSARRSSCATTCSACSATRRSPASRSATTCARASRRRCSPSPSSRADAGQRRRARRASARPTSTDDEVGAIQQVLVDTGALAELEAAHRPALADEAVDALDRRPHHRRRASELVALAALRRRPDRHDARSSSSAPASAGCRPPATSPATATTSSSSSATSVPGGRAGHDRARRLPLRHRPDGAHHARICWPTSSPPPAPTWPTHVTLRPVDPMYRAVLRRRLRAARPPRPRGDDRGDPAGLRRRARRPRSSASATGSTELYELEMPNFIDATSTRRSTSSGRWRAGAAARPPRRRSAGSAARSRRSSPTSGCSGSSASSRCTPAWRPTRRSPSTPSSPTWTRSTACSSPTAACTPWPPGWPPPPRRPAPTFRYDAAGRADRARPATAARSRASSSPAASASPPTPSCATPTCPSPTATLLGGVDAAAGRPPRPVLAVVPAVAGRRARRCRPPAPPTTTSTSAQHWDGAFRALLHDGVRMPDPSILVTLPSLDDPSLAPAGRTTLYVLEPVPEPRRQRRLDAASATRLATTCGARSPPLGYPTDVEVERVVDPLDWERRAWSGARRSRSRTRSSRPARSGPRNVDRRVPGLVFVGSRHRARRRRPDGADLGQAGRRAGRAMEHAAPMTRRSRSRSPTPAAAR